MAGEEFVSNYRDRWNPFPNEKLQGLLEEDVLLIRSYEMAVFDHNCQVLFRTINVPLKSQLSFAKAYQSIKQGGKEVLGDSGMFDFGDDASPEASNIAREIYEKLFDELITNLQIWWIMYYTPHKPVRFGIEKEIDDYVKAGPGGGCATVILLIMATGILTSLL